MSNIDRMLISKLDNNCDLLSSAKNNFRYVGEVNMSSRKLDFKTWCNDICIRECDQTTKCDDCKAAWNFCQAQEKKEAQAKQAMYDEKYTELHKANVALMDEMDTLKLQNKKAINAFKALNRYLCNGEHVDLCWVKDEIQLQAESEILIKSKHFLESAKLKRDIDDLKKKLTEFENLCADKKARAFLMGMKMNDEVKNLLKVVFIPILFFIR